MTGECRRGRTGLIYNRLTVLAHGSRVRIPPPPPEVSNLAPLSACNTQRGHNLTGTVDAVSGRHLKGYGLRCLKSRKAGYRGVPSWMRKP